MAQKTTVTVVDDIDGTELTDDLGETVTFGLDGVTYEIDLSADHARELRDSIGIYAEHARKVTSRARGNASGARPSRRNNSEFLGSARVWLRENGHEVSDRGRIAQPLLDLYRQSGAAAME